MHYLIDEDHRLFEEAVEHHRSAHLLVTLVFYVAHDVVILRSVAAEVLGLDGVLACQLLRALAVVFVACLQVVQESRTLVQVPSHVYLEFLLLSEVLLELVSDHLLQTVSNLQVETHLFFGAKQQAGVIPHSCQGEVNLLLLFHPFDHFCCLVVHDIDPLQE